ncbi:MAG: uracil phosphoribosyltransferase [Planctomycetes bacterium]|nr:uracil phosphoribosyltransferase [Planctomycetota bacterium]
MDLHHRYGPAVHLLDDSYLLSLLARIGSPETETAILAPLVRSAYRRLCQEVLAREFPTEEVRVPTRMAASEPRAFYEGRRLCQRTPLVLCAVIRAGILPAQACFETACEVLHSRQVRLDFVNMSRVTDAQGQVTGVRLDGSKIGGGIDDAVLLIPDPMGATGGTVARTVETYRALAGGPPRKVVAMHLMITPEAVQRITHAYPEVTIYAARLDRGLSPAEVLRSIPGTFPDQERGLNDHQYIVPGAGGMGELLTNSWV